MHEVTASELRRFLVDAAGLIQRYGWWNCGLGDRSTGFCIVGALDEVYNSRDTIYGTRNVSIAWLEHLIGAEPLHKWNDAYGNQMKCIDYLLRAAETADLAVERLKDYSWT